MFLVFACMRTHIAVCGHIYSIHADTYTYVDTYAERLQVTGQIRLDYVRLD